MALRKHYSPCTGERLHLYGGEPMASGPFSDALRACRRALLKTAAVDAS